MVEACPPSIRALLEWALLPFILPGHRAWAFQDQNCSLLHLHPTAATMIIRPTDWKSRAPAPPPNTKTFSGQAALPSLPVPDLDISLDQLKISLLPFARSKEELQAVECKIEELRSGGLGRKLQQRLLQRKEEKDKCGSSWLEEWWDDVSHTRIAVT